MKDWIKMRIGILEFWNEKVRMGLDLWHRNGSGILESLRLKECVEAAKRNSGIMDVWNAFILDSWNSVILDKRCISGLSTGRKTLAELVQFP